VVGLISVPVIELLPGLASALSVGLAVGLDAGLVARLVVKRVGIAANAPPP
jgi:hypothetical protein